MKRINQCKITLPAKSVNEGYARAAVAAFAALADPTLEELSDIRTAVSEAVTNCIVHAYREKAGLIYIDLSLTEDNVLKIRVKDKGCGIADIEQARQPLFTTAGEERSGLGFTVMESFSDKLAVRSAVGKGTTVTITKRIQGKPA